MADKNKNTPSPKPKNDPPRPKPDAVKKVHGGRIKDQPNKRNKS